MEISEVEKHLNEVEKNIGLQEYLLKYPIDMLMGFNKENLKQKLEENAVKLFDFEILLLKAEARYIELKDMYLEVLAEQFDWYKFEYDKSLSTAEIKEFYLQKDPAVKKIKRLLDKQIIQKNFFELCIRSLIRQGERMHDFIKV